MRGAFTSTTSTTTSRSTSASRRPTSIRRTPRTASDGGRWRIQLQFLAMSDGAESTSEAVTHNVRVSVRARYVPERSNPGDSEWFFAYTIEIANESDRTVQLLSRHWIITDADG